MVVLVCVRLPYGRYREESWTLLGYRILVDCLGLACLRSWLTIFLYAKRLLIIITKIFKYFNSPLCKLRILRSLLRRCYSPPGDNYSPLNLITVLCFLTNICTHISKNKQPSRSHWKHWHSIEVTRNLWRIPRLRQLSYNIKYTRKLQILLKAIQKHKLLRLSLTAVVME